MDFYTYLYKDPKTDIPIYIGKGHGRRAFKHCWPKLDTFISRTLKKRKAEGYKIEPIINYEVDEQTAFEMEKFWIEIFGRKDLDKGTLLNLTDGGEGPSGAIRTEETKAKMSKAMKGIPKSEESKAKMSLAKKDYVPWNKGIVGGQVAHNKGVSCPEHLKARISATLTGRKQSPETIAKRMEACRKYRESRNG